MTPYQQGEAAAKADALDPAKAKTDNPYWPEAGLNGFKAWLDWSDAYIATWERLKDSPTMERTHEAD